MPKRLAILRPLLENWGFSSGWDYVSTVFGLRALDYFSWVVQIVGALITGSFVLMAEWVWEPPGAAVLIIAMNLLNARYGYLVSHKIKGEKFNPKKFHRTFAIVVSDVLLLSMIHAAVKFYPYYSPLSHVLFGWLFMHRLLSIIKHMADLKLQDGGLKRYIRTWIQNRLKSELGTHLVDNMQQDDPLIKDEEEPKH